MDFPHDAIDLENFMSTKTILHSDTASKFGEGIKFLIQNDKNYDMITYNDVISVSFNIDNLKLGKKNRYYYDYKIGHNSDMIDNITCDVQPQQVPVKLYYSIKNHQYSLKKMNEILLIHMRYTCAYPSILRITFLEKPEQEGVINIHSRRYLMKPEHRQTLAINPVKTKSMRYMCGLCGYTYMDKYAEKYEDTVHLETVESNDIPYVNNNGVLTTSSRKRYRTDYTFGSEISPASNTPSHCTTTMYPPSKSKNYSTGIPSIFRVGSYVEYRNPEDGKGIKGRIIKFNVNDTYNIQLHNGNITTFIPYFNIRNCRNINNCSESNENTITLTRTALYHIHEQTCKPFEFWYHTEHQIATEQSRKAAEQSQKLAEKSSTI